jgi:hypothetical protein
MIKLGTLAILIAISSAIFFDMSKIYVTEDFERPYLYRIKAFFMSFGANLVRKLL